MLCCGPVSVTVASYWELASTKGSKSRFSFTQTSWFAVKLDASTSSNLKPKSFYSLRTTAVETVLSHKSWRKTMKAIQNAWHTCFPVTGHSSRYKVFIPGMRCHQFPAFVQQLILFVDQVFNKYKSTTTTTTVAWKAHWYRAVQGHWLVEVATKSVISVTSR